MKSENKEASAILKAAVDHGKSLRADNYTNVLSGFGGNKDPMQRTQFSFSAGLINNPSALEVMFRYDWVVARVIEAIVQDSLREWIDFNTEEQDVVQDVNDQLDQLDAVCKFEEAMVLARLYGGSVMILGTDGDADPEEPLQIDSLGAIESLSVLDRYQLRIVKRFSDATKPFFGEPEVYALQEIDSLGSQNFGQRIHASRLLKFDGAFLPKRQLIGNDGWHDSILIKIEEALKKHGVSIQSGVVLMQDFITKVLKIPNLAEILADEETASQTLEARMQFAIQAFSSVGITLVGEDEDFKKVQTPINGLDKLMDKYVEHVAAAADMPRTRMFGQQLGTLAGADETTRGWFDKVSAYQGKHLKNPLNKLLFLILSSKNSATKGTVPDSWGFKFNPLWQPTEKEQAETREIMSRSDKNYIETGVLSADEVADSRFSDSGYSLETSLDGELRSEMGSIEPDEED